MPDKMAKQVQSQFTGLVTTDMTAYTLERTKSDFYGAKTDLAIYSGDGTLVLHGRDFGDRIFYWQP